MVRFPVSCPALDDPPGGFVNVTGPQPIGVIARYNCIAGLTSGDLQRSCLIGGIWSGQPAVCYTGMYEINPFAL